MNRQTEISLKTERIARVLHEENLGAVILNSQANFAWATAGASNGVDTSRENGAASLLIRRDGKRFVLANRIEMPRLLAEEISAADFEPVEFGWEDEKAASNFLPNRAAGLLETNAALATDLILNANVRSIESAIARCRYQLIKPEIERYRALGKDAGAALGALMKTLQPGETELTIASRARQILAERRIQTIVCLVAADERLNSFRHPVPTEKSWDKTVMVVVCAKRDGLIASLSRIVCVNRIPAELQRKTRVCARVNAALWAATKPGATGAELYKIAAETYAAAGFANEIHLHHQGGAIGYRTRDWTAHPASTDCVQTAQAFAWNPSISGSKTEETVIVHDDRIETITQSPDWSQIAIEADGREYSLPDILSL